MQQNNDADYLVYRESEHQELWYPDADLTKPVPVHIPSALGVLGYYVCVRVPEPRADKLGAVEVTAKIGGLRPDDLRLKAGQGVTCEDRIPSESPGYVWRLLCRAFMSRGDGVLTFTNWPSGLAPIDLLLCTWPRYVSSGQADDYLVCQADPLWTPTGVPLGGIGGGRIDICRDGLFRNFSGNNNQDMPFEDPAGIPGACFWIQKGNKRYSLTSSTMFEAAPSRNLSFTGRFPQARLAARSILPGLDITITATGMLCPHDLRRSSIPGILMRWHLTNRGKSRQEIQCLFIWPNLIGEGGGIAQQETDTGKGDGYYCYWEEPAGRTATELTTDLYAGVVFTGGANLHRKNSSGKHLLAVKRGPGSNHGVRLDDEFAAVWREVVLPPGEEQTVDMALVWAMPHWVDCRGADRGHYWQNHFIGAEEMVHEVLSNADEIFRDAGALAALFDRTTLPGWLKARMSNCNYPLVTNSVHVRDGRFSINEGPTEMSGCYGTIDQRLGAHPAAHLLFPELNARELSQFAAIQTPNGGIAHDFGCGWLEAGPSDQPWPDIPCSFIIQCARHAWSTGDGDFDERMWPNARKALLRVAEWADAGGGIPQVGHGLGTSYDGYHYDGTTPYLGTLWLASLAIAEKWARLKGDADLPPRIERWRTAAMDRLEADLWNGSFYRTCGSPNGPRRDTCFAGMLAGQVFCRMLAGRDVLPPDRLAACVDALMRLNGSDRFGVPPDEAAPDGDAAVEFGWLPYVEAFAVTAAATLRHPRALPLWRKMIEAVNQDGRRLCDTRLMYRPITGEPSWGAYYMTAPASWLVYDALLDFFYSPADGVLRLNPQLPGTAAVVHPLWWGIAETHGSSITLRIDSVFSRNSVAIRAVELPNSDARAADRYVRLELPEPVQVKPGASVTWQTR